MQLRKLGNSSLMVSPIGVGFWGIVGGDYWGAQDETDTVRRGAAPRSTAVSTSSTQLKATATATPKQC